MAEAIPRLAQALAHAARGFVIGSAELVPGVSGGTVALVTGIYEQLVRSAAAVVGGLGRAVRGPDRAASARESWRRVDGWLLGPVVLGMLIALLTVAGVMEGFVSDHPELARGLFLGLVVASISVPVRMVAAEPEGWSWRDALLVGACGALTFTLVGLAGGRSVEDPPLVLVAAVAAVAVCALVVPGVSGSFLLLALGLYSTTLRAVSDRDVVYVGAFALGALLGLGTFVRILRWLLGHHRRTTLLAMTGLMAGSVRALWPWQGGPGSGRGAGAAVAPYDPVLGPVLLALLGVAVVSCGVWLEARSQQEPRPSEAGRR